MVSADEGHPGTMVSGLVALQLALGLANVLLLAPVWMQLVHLLVADLVWIALVHLLALMLAPEHERVRVRQPAPAVAR